MLSEAAVARFIADGFVRIDNAFAPELAAEARAILWREMGLDPALSEGWRPVVRLGMHAERPFVAAANTPALTHAYDRLVGAGRWLPPRAVGTFVVRFPSDQPPGDDGWHIDVSYGTDAPDFLDWRANVMSRGRALLMLLLFSDVGPDNAPTRIRTGSHHAVARMLAPAGEAGLTLREIAARIGETDDCPEALATGAAGTVYLCHPFLVHSAQRQRGGAPRFLAQPPLLPRAPIALERDDGAYSPVEVAIREAIGAQWLTIRGAAGKGAAFQRSAADSDVGSARQQSIQIPAATIGPR